MMKDFNAVSKSFLLHCLTWSMDCIILDAKMGFVSNSMSGYKYFLNPKQLKVREDDPYNRNNMILNGKTNETFFIFIMHQ